MNFKDLQTSWQNQPTPPTVAPEAQLADVRRRAARFRRTIFWRDLREVLTGIFLILFFGYIAATSPGEARWGAVAMIAGAAFVTLFFVVDRARQHARERRHQGDRLVKAIQASLDALDHQIGLLRNVFWWYLLPLDLGMLGWAVGLGLQGPLGLVFWLPAFLLIAAPVSYFVWRLNRKAVRDELQPQREALARLLSDIMTEPAADGPASPPAH